MSELGTEFEPDSAVTELLDVRSLKIGFVSSEPLGTMLRMERLPPPTLAFDAGVGTPGQTQARPTAPNSSSLKLQAAKLRLDLAELVISRQDDILAARNPGVIEGLNEVHRFLVHCEHLRLLQES